MKEYRVKPDSQLNLDTCDPDDTGEYKKTDQGKEKAKAVTDQLIGRLEELQERLYANGDRAVLIVLQGMDSSGKDGTIKHVMSGVNPQGCKVVTFKAPVNSELAHDFLWRVHHEGAGQRTDRDLQPVALRRRAYHAGPQDDLSQSGGTTIKPDQRV